VRKTPPSAGEARIAAKVWQFYTGDREGAVAWLKTLGCVVASVDGDCYTLQGIAGVRSALLPTDPSTIAVCFGFLLAGASWPQVYPGLLPAVNRLLDMETKAKKAAAAEEEAETTDLPAVPEALPLHLRNLQAAGQKTLDVPD